MVQTKLIISSFNNLRGILKGPPDLPDFKFVIIFSISIDDVIHIQYQNDKPYLVYSQSWCHSFNENLFRNDRTENLKGIDCNLSEKYFLNPQNVLKSVEKR